MDKDGVMSDGWKSRKMWLTVLAMSLIMVGFYAAGHPPALYGTYCASILGAATVFKAANLVEKLKGGSDVIVTTPAGPPNA